jgi:hypothetical protein
MARGFHKPIDGSHQPFKRLRKLGTGPRGREPIAEKKHWMCSKFDDYAQFCVWIGPKGKGHKRGARKLVVTNPKWKSKYNAEYTVFRNSRPVKPRVNAAQPGYRCRSKIKGACKRRAR